MKRLFLVTFALLTSACFPARAQDFGEQVKARVDADTVVRSVQCEMGRFARALRRYNVPSNRLNATIVVTKKIETNANWGLDIRAAIITLLGGVHYQGGNLNTNTLKIRRYHINSANDRACNDRNNIVLHDLRQCLSEDAPNFAKWDIDCVSQINVKVDASAGITLPVNVVTIGPTASWGSTFTHAVQVTAPPPGP